MAHYLNFIYPYYTGTTVLTNYRKGITVTSLVYNHVNDLLLLYWEATGTYQLHLTSCNNSVWEESNVSTCKPALLTGIKHTFGDSSVFVNVRACDDQNECTFSPPTGAVVGPQTLISLNLSSESKSCHNTKLFKLFLQAMSLPLTASYPQDRPAETFQGNKCFLQSKLWSVCSPNGLKLSVSSATKTLNYTVINDLDFGKDEQFLRYELQSDRVQICTKGEQFAKTRIQRMFGIVSELIIQEYCTDVLQCGGVFSTAFGDRFRLILTPSPTAGNPYP